MRASTIYGDPGFPNRLALKNLILLDGKRQKMVLTADEETDYVLRIATDSKGRPLRSPTREILTEEVSGKVKITPAQIPV